MKKQPKLNDQPCPFCKEPVNIDAIRCPHCQADYSPEQVSQRKAANKKANKQGLIGCLVLGVVAVVGLATCTGGDDDSTDDSAPAAAVSSANLKADADAFVKAVHNSGRGCDYALQEAGAAMGKEDIVDAYSRSKHAEDVCLKVKVKDVPVPKSFDKAQKEKANEALDRCESVYVNKWSVAKLASKILDGGNSVSAQAEFRDRARDVQSLTLLCSVGLIQVDAFGEPETGGGDAAPTEEAKSATSG